MSGFHVNATAVGSPDGVRGPDKRLETAAEEFEAIFLAQILRGMSTGLEDSGPMGNADEDPFADMLQQEYAKLISRSGGVGIGDAVLQEMLQTQEVGS